MAKLTDMHVRELTHTITLRVRGLKGWGVRLWLAGKLFQLGAWVAGVGIIMEPGEPEPAPPIAHGHQPRTGDCAPDNPPNQGSAGRRPPPPPNTGYK